MKVIKMGRQVKKRVYRVTCANCRTIYEFDESEGFKYDEDKIRASCPNCGCSNARRIWDYYDENSDDE